MEILFATRDTKDRFELGRTYGRIFGRRAKKISERVTPFPLPQPIAGGAVVYTAILAPFLM